MFFCSCNTKKTNDELKNEAIDKVAKELNENPENNQTETVGFNLRRNSKNKLYITGNYHDYRKIYLHDALSFIDLYLQKCEEKKNLSVKKEAHELKEFIESRILE